MGFLKKLFGGEKKSSPYVDTRGVYFYIRCDNCKTVVKLRADKEYDLERQENGYRWHKTVVDNKCFRAIPTVVVLDGSYNVVDAEISGGEYVDEATYEAFLASQVRDITVDKSEDE